AIGGSNGLANTPASFAGYLGSIASTDTQVEIFEGYAHLDVVSAVDNEAVPPILKWISRVWKQKQIALDHPPPDKP
ncbi:MAG: hypothetical protein R3253_01640, partial [Longimicrobiales bacterium]|nr:hypothetical protein [Longimicrobiales bacterium]